MLITQITGRWGLILYHENIALYVDNKVLIFPFPSYEQITAILNTCVHLALIQRHLYHRGTLFMRQREPPSKRISHFTLVVDIVVLLPHDRTASPGLPTRGEVEELDMREVPALFGFVFESLPAAVLRV